MNPKGQAVAGDVWDPLQVVGKPWQRRATIPPELITLTVHHPRFLVDCSPAGNRYSATVSRKHGPIIRVTKSALTSNASLSHYDWRILVNDYFMAWASVGSWAKLYFLKYSRLFPSISLNSTRSISSPFLAIVTAPTMNCSSQPPHDVSVHPAFLEPVQKYPATCWEIVLALFSSLITGAYTLHHNENQVRHPFPFLPSQNLPLTTANNRSRESVSRCLSSRF